MIHGMVRIISTDNNKSMIQICYVVGTKNVAKGMKSIAQGAKKNEEKTSCQTKVS